MRNKLLLLLLLVLLCDCECRKTVSSRRKSKGNSGSGLSTGQSSPSTSGQSSGGWFSWGSSSKSTVTNPKPANKPPDTAGWKKPDTGTNTQSNYGWKKDVTQGNAGTHGSGTQTGNYGWNKPAGTNTQAKASAPSSNIGPGGYPVQGGVNSGSVGGSYPHNTGTGTQNAGFTNQNRGPPPPYSGAQSPGSFNQAPPPYSAGGYQSGGYNTGHHQTGGYQQPGGYNTGYHQPGGYNTGGVGQGYHGSNSYATPNQHGFGSSSYPAQNSFGYPGQGLYGGSQSAKYNGMGIFGGSSGHYGYPSNSGWGSNHGSSYGAPKSGSGSMLKGLAIGAAGGYLTSSLISKISNPWGSSSYGYGGGYGYDRGSHWRRDDERRETSTTAPVNDPSSGWVHCVAFDPVTKETMINPNCSCTVTTMVDPNTNQPISTHNCTTANGQVIQQPMNQPLPTNFEQRPAGVDYGGATAYAAGLPYQSGYMDMPASTVLPVVDNVNSTTVEQVEGAVNSTDVAPDSQMQTGGGTDSDLTGKRNEFYRRLERFVNMGKFIP